MWPALNLYDGCIMAHFILTRDLLKYGITITITSKNPLVWITVDLNQNGMSITLILPTHEDT